MERASSSKTETASPLTTSSSNRIGPFPFPLTFGCIPCGNSADGIAGGCGTGMARKGRTAPRAGSAHHGKHGWCRAPCPCILRATPQHGEAAVLWQPPRETPRVFWTTLGCGGMPQDPVLCQAVTSQPCREACWLWSARWERTLCMGAAWGCIAHRECVPHSPEWGGGAVCGGVGRV